MVDYIWWPNILNSSSIINSILLRMLLIKLWATCCNPLYPMDRFRNLPAVKYMHIVKIHGISRTERLIES